MGPSMHTCLVHTIQERVQPTSKFWPLIVWPKKDSGIGLVMSHYTSALIDRIVPLSRDAHVQTITNFCICNMVVKETVGYHMTPIMCTLLGKQSLATTLSTYRARNQPRYSQNRNKVLTENFLLHETVHRNEPTQSTLHWMIKSKASEKFQTPGNWRPLGGCLISTDSPWAHPNVPSLFTHPNAHRTQKSHIWRNWKGLESTQLLHQSGRLAKLANWALRPKCSVSEIHLTRRWIPSNGCIRPSMTPAKKWGAGAICGGNEGPKRCVIGDLSRPGRGSDGGVERPGSV